MNMRDLIGKAYAVPCDPPGTYDCWELAIEVRRRLGLATPLYVQRATRTKDSLTENADLLDKEWVEIDEHRPGTLVTFGTPALHCGVVVEGAKVLHASTMGVGMHDMAIAVRAFGAVRFWELAP